MLKCVTRSPARRQGPTPFLEIQVSDLLDLQILVKDAMSTVRAPSYIVPTDSFYTLSLP
jgi:hypothetical protein